MGRLSTFAFVLTPLMFAAAGSARAHHSFAAEFEPDTRGEVTGEITRVWFTNPHVRYRINATNEDGSVDEWELQLTSVTNLRAQNWFDDTLEVGDVITAQGELGRNSAKKIYVRGIQTADGTDLLAYGRTGRTQDPRELESRDPASYGYGKVDVERPFDITGAWRNRYKFHVTVDDLEPKPTPFTPEARAIYEATEHYDDYSLRCMAPGLPRIFGSPYNMEIVDAGTHYLVVHVEHNMPRRIYMDGRTPPENTPATSLGYSVGHWESDDVLVIETTHLTAGWLDGSGLPMSGDGTRIVERWELAPDRLSMDRIMTIYDPYYTAPLVRRRGSARGNDVEIIEQATCDPASYYRDLYESGQIEEQLYK